MCACVLFVQIFDVNKVKKLNLCLADNLAYKLIVIVISFVFWLNSQPIGWYRARNISLSLPTSLSFALKFLCIGTSDNKNGNNDQTDERATCKSSFVRDR